MMHMNKTRVTAPAGGYVTAFAPGAVSSGATLNRRFPAAV